MPDSVIGIHEWHIDYVKWLEQVVESSLFNDTVYCSCKIPKIAVLDDDELIKCTCGKLIP